MRRLAVTLGLCCGILASCSSTLLAQTERKAVRKGNKEFNKGDFLSSEIAYRVALDVNDKSFKANFNLGDALYKQEKYEEAIATFDALEHSNASSTHKAGVYHNIGNAHFQDEKIEESIEAYKQALRLNPNDMETKYNLAEAQRRLQQQEDEENPDNQDGEGGDSPENNDDQDKQDENKDNNEDNQNQDDQQQDNREQQISPEDAQRMLDAIQNKEKDIQDRVKEEKAKQAKVRVEKNW